MSTNPRHSPRRKSTTLAQFCQAMEHLAPTGLAQSWDNVGLIAGDTTKATRHVLLCVDLTPAVLAEATKSKVDLVLAYHPPIFKPIVHLRAPGIGTEAIVFDCIRSGIAIYSTHTALDAADGGTNDILASLAGCQETQPLEYVDTPGADAVKLVVFVQADQVERMAQALFAAGAGRIGDYSQCSYRLLGTGTFLGNSSTKPIVGRAGVYESMDEMRLETIVPAAALPKVVDAMTQAHPYDEPAYDIYPLTPTPTRGIGRVARLPSGTTLGKLARKLQRATGSTIVQLVGDKSQSLARAIVVAGAAGSLPFQLDLTTQDVIVTGEIRHHDALTIARIGCAAIALGHWSSERPALQSLADRLTERLPGLRCQLSTSDREPFARL